jgi:carbamoyl-phosphate synthase large subunit
MTAILFTSIGRRVQLIRHFVSAGVRVIGTDINPVYAPASQMVDQVYKVPKYSDPTYTDTLISICTKEKVSLVIPLYEPELPLLADYRYQFSENNVDLVLSEKQVLEKCLDKYKFYQFCMENNIVTPDTYLPAIFNRGQLADKWVVKPRRGMGSKDVYIIDNAERLSEKVLEVDSPVIQEFINGTEYTIDALVDKKHQVRSIVPRIRLETRSGEVSKSITSYDQNIINETRRVLESLRCYGPMTVQGIKEHQSGQFFFTEINPRFGGGVPLSIQAGVSYAALLVDGEEKKEELIPFQNNLMMLRYDDAYYINMEEQWE